LVLREGTVAQRARFTTVEELIAICWSEAG